jgi:hypothetical protein
MDKYARLVTFYARLQEAAAVQTHDEAYALLRDTLNAVEDEFSGVANNPANWRTDGRLYPPQKDRVYVVPGFPEVLRFNSFKHDTYIASNGAIEVKAIPSGDVQFSKLGANGKGVWE